ncbi:chondroitinase family polysaccharide lyase [uncultured Fusobacterium sp.]|uniref:chondroitinase family polysaccharide lyase n=1 Tax=uncultured Fusobacterium sp. TaxID=159267 RepID=UPI002803C978|nr:chondroitinase family polysaccharide lyase [uncultured Fusobacterium sp.]
MCKKYFYLLLIFIVSISSYSNTLYQFEKGVPNNFITDKNSKIEITKEKSKDGTSSLKWDFEKNSTLTIKGDVGYKIFQQGMQEKARSSFVMWIYNKKPIVDKMQVQFKKKGEVKSYFSINMNFTGWRTMWVQYDRDMSGKAEENMDEITFISPNVNGEIYIDQIYTSILIDPRHNARDEQVDFVNLQADNAVNSHWMALYKNYNAISQNKDIQKLTSEEIKGIKSVENRFRNDIIKKVKVNSKLIEKNREKLQEYLTTTVVSPQTIVLYKDFSKEEKSYLKDVQIKEYGSWLRELAFMYNSTEDKKYKKEIYEIFKKGLNHLYEQGWTKGSCQGTIHHLGYQVRELYQSIFLMKEPLLKDKNLKQAKEMVTWYSAMGILYTPDSEIKGVNADVLNTMLPGMLIAILLNDDDKVTASQLYQLNHYLTKSIDYAPGLLGGFKEDGSMFHHMQNYPAYAKGAFEGLTPIMYYLGNTAFALDDYSFNIVKKAVLMTRVYSNTHTWLISISGRHPDDRFQISDEVFRYLALGKKVGNDSELANAYLRLAPQGRFAEELSSLGFKAETTPQGAWTMNMSSLQLHRRDNWLIGVKGYSRYLVGNETYIKNNLFGRYMSYGNFQILENSLIESGYVQQGWDWAHFPGTTAIALPIDKLKSPISQVDIYSGVEEMLLSDETFSGGNSLNNNGMFAMKLHEHSKYNDTHRARKSVFLFDNRVILLGSNIENKSDYETHTTLFQNYLSDKNSISKVEKIKNNNFILDTQNNLYKVVEGNLKYKNGLQHSLDQNKGTPTENYYEMAYINHGKNPKNQKYQYAILVKGDKEEQEIFKKNSNYQVLQQDYNAHIVEDEISKMRGYALFESGDVKDKYLKSIDTPSLILIKPNDNSLELSFVDPDLRLYEGKDESQYEKNGKLKEVSIYSRKWNSNPSIPHTSTIILNGKYSLEKENKDISIEILDNTTIIKITTTYAMPVKLTLRKL